ncbi:hypothetical protein HOLleu_38747 [Holothuria leucospilota]|uniref:Uncharacterized protein n=1 Tax=Holothuria leucospilota TaxID=206669 RepID=A0A9Q1BDK8_HOLLE|nr:hypothetical protein HOLleu_38747 [Holothuria leucospilota]
MTAITGGSKVSRISASAVQSAKAKAVAQSVAAKERLHFIEEIAKKKAELEILKARQEAAEAAAVVEALSETNGSLRSGCNKFIPQTSPNDTANDHAQRFREKQHAAEKESSNPQIGDKLASNLQVKEEIQEKSGINSPTLPETIPNTVQSLAEAMSSAISLNKIPAPEPGIFRGDPLSYPDWRISVRTLLEEKCIPKPDRIHYLKNYLGDPAKQAVSGFFLLKDELAYQKESRYGNPYKVAEAFRTKLHAWPRIDSRNNEELQRFLDFLNQCSVAMDEFPTLDILNDTREINRLLESCLAC